MQFAREKSDALTIRAYTAGEVVIGERRMTSSFIVTPDEVVSNWAPKRPTELDSTHIADILALKPDIIVIGTGAKLEFPDTAVIAGITSRGVGVEVMDTGAACRTYNVLVHEGRRVAAAILLGD